MNDRKHQYRRTSIRRAIRTIKALNRECGVTVKELADYLEFKSTNPATRYHSAMRWIDVASTEIAVVELDARRYSQGAACDIKNHRSNGGSMAKVYGVIKDAI